ncbi:MAG: glycosyltransferase family 4 protein [Candidatus Kerfeldbacteria bacterium]|nr:glycosyltransferase family 4 protein [Candidatus Kerfeldbacteria bacterium]
MVIGIEAAKANEPHKTGTEWYAHTLIREIVGIDRSLNFLLYSNAPLEPALAELGPNAQARILRWPPRYLWHQLRLSLEMAVHPPDVFFAPAHTIPLVHPRRTFTMIHDIGFDRIPEAYSTKERLYNRWALRFALRHAAGLLVPSEWTKQEILDRYPFARNREHDIAVIHHGFDADRARPSQPPEADVAVLNRYGIQAPYILFVGRLQEKKNVARLVAAFASLKENATVSLVLAGKPDFGFARVQSIIHTHHLDDRVVLPGYVAHEDLPVLVRAARVFAFPSLYEGFGFPVLEAQANSTPVLASRAASLPEIGGHGALYVDPYSVASLADGLHRLLGDDQLRADLVLHGRANLNRFRWSDCAQRTLSILTGGVFEVALQPKRW